jgi:hypothetical protein
MPGIVIAMFEIKRLDQSWTDRLHSSYMLTRTEEQLVQSMGFITLVPT